MKKSIYYRNFLATALILLLSFIILGGVFTTWSYRIIMNEQRKGLSNTADDVADMVAAYCTEMEPDSLEIRMVISSAARSSNFHIMLADAEGTVISCSDREVLCEHMGKRLPSDTAGRMLDGNYSGTSSLGGLFDSSRYIVGRPVLSYQTGEPICSVIVSADRADMSELWRHFAGVFMMTAILVIILTFIISFFTTKKQAEPLNEMARAAHRFARGDFSTRVSDADREDEIGQLSAAFNLMADSLERSENLRREFIANVSHELKTPMTTISGFADGILDGTIPPEMEKRYLQVISSETHRLSRLVRNMLDMSQLTAIDTATVLKGSFDITEIIRLSLLSLEQKITAKGLDVDAQLPEEAVVTRGSRDAIQQVVYNLLDNAIKFSSEGGTINVSVWKQGEKAYVSVENSGQTIPQEELPLIFDRFHKTDRSRSSDREGVGLGLYIVKTILDHHNEDIFVSSADGITKFVFTLALAQQNS